MTKHYGLRLSKTPQDIESLFAHGNTQAIADATRGAVPKIMARAEGSATVESFSIPSNRDGSPSHAVILARMESGERTLARIDGGDTEAMVWLMDNSRYPIGDKGRVVKAEKGPAIWERT